MTFQGDVRVCALYMAVFAWRAVLEPCQDALVWLCLCVGATHVVLMLVCTLTHVAHAQMAKMARKVTLD